MESNQIKSNHVPRNGSSHALQGQSLVNSRHRAARGLWRLAVAGPEHHPGLAATPSLLSLNQIDNFEVLEVKTWKIDLRPRGFGDWEKNTFIAIKCIK